MPEEPTKLKDFPAMFNQTEIPFFYGQEQFSKVQTSNQSESGKDLIQITRDSKLTIPCSFEIADVAWVKTFREFSLMKSFKLKLYDVLKDEYTEYTVRMEDYSHIRKRKSDQLEEIKGVWTVAFTLQEF